VTCIAIVTGIDMNPDWKDAPEWANWLVFLPIDGWVWVENEPTYWINDLNGWQVGGCGKTQFLMPYKAKEQRPIVSA